MPLIGNCVLLRALEQRDLGPIWEAYKDFDLELITSGDSPPLSDRQVTAFWSERIDNPAPNMRYFVIEPLPGQKGGGQFAGMCNLQDIDMRNRHGELAIWLASPELRGHGYGTDAIQTLLPYAFEVAHLEKVYLGAYDFNEGGLRCYERIGFRYEGRLRHQIYYRGRYWDEWSMGMLYTEWALICHPPVDGLRPYHPADLKPGLGLIQRTLGAPDEEAAYAMLRRWRRQIDREVYSYQIDDALVGLCTVPIDRSGHAPIEVAVIDEYREHLNAGLLAGPTITQQPPLSR